MIADSLRQGMTGRTLAVLIAVLFLSSPVSSQTKNETPDERQRRELEDEVCTASRAEADACGFYKSGGECLPALVERVSALCRRYQARYGESPEECCERVKPAIEMERMGQAMRKADERISRLPLDARVRPCREFFARWEHWPTVCTQR